MRETMKQMMADAPAEAVKPKIIANNTVEYHVNGERRIRLHHTDIITYRPNGDVVLSSGSWQTVTTKERFNRYGFRVSQARGQWYLGDVPFYDGIVLPKGQPPKPTAKAAKVEKANAKLAKDILKFCRLVDTVAELPIPNAGDCWCCAMVDKDGEPMGGGDHLRQHIKEGYLHGSLIVNAMRWAGYRTEQVGLFYRMNLRDRIKNTLRRYLRHEFGLPV